MSKAWRTAEHTSAEQDNLASPWCMTRKAKKSTDRYSDVEDRYPLLRTSTQQCGKGSRGGTEK